MEQEAEEECGGWNGISSPALTFRLFVLEKERALGLFCRDYTKRGPKWGLRRPPPPSSTYRESSLLLRDKKGSAMLVWTEPCRNLLMSLFLFGGAEKGCELLDALPRTTRGGSCVQEESTKQRRLAQKGSQNQRRRTSELEVPLNKTTRVKVLHKTHSGKPKMPKRFLIPAANTQTGTGKFFQ